jgi:hypothetical protein
MSGSAVDADAGAWAAGFQSGKATNEIGGSCQGESKNDAARVTSETTRKYYEGEPALGARVDFPIKIS